MLDTVDFNHVQHISFTQSLLTDAVSVILSELLSYEHPPKGGGRFRSALWHTPPLFPHIDGTNESWGGVCHEGHRRRTGCGAGNLHP